MGTNKGYPKFIWIIVAVILVTVVGYALLSRQPIDEVKFPGGGVKFGSKQGQESVTFSISYDKSKSVIEGRADVFLANVPAITLSVDRQRAFQTKSVTVPNPGTYAYRIEQREVRLLVSGSDLKTEFPVNVDIRGEGKINVKPGVSYKITPVYIIQDRNWIAILEEILSEEEKIKLEEDSLKELDELERELSNN